MSAEPIQDFAETIVYIPGIACQVYVGIADDQFRDRLQQAVIALMRISPLAAARPYAAKELADDLCVPVGIIEAVLLTLEQEGLVRCSDGLFTLADRSANSAQLRNTTGWMFWNCLEREFLPLLILDEADDGLPRNPASETEYEYLKRRSAGDTIPQGAMLEASRHPDFLVGKLGPNGSVTMANDHIVRAISREGLRRDWPLAVTAQIRPRFGGAPGIFLNESRPFPDWPKEPHFSSPLAKIIEEQLPQVHKELHRRAADLEKEFLRENCAEFLAKLGGEEVVRKEAYGQVEKGLAGVKLAAPFLSEELKSAAADAELNYMLFQHDEKLMSEASVRRDFATILQGVGCVVADLSEDSLHKKDLLDALDDQYYNDLEGRHERDVHLYWRDRLTDLSYDLGCDLRDWDYIPGRLLDLNKFLKTVSYPSGRHTLGTAFICWCAVPLLGATCPTAQNHLKWMVSALARMPDLPARFNAVKDIRNDDKSVQKGSRTMSLDDFRLEVYALWRAMGSDWQH